MEFSDIPQLTSFINTYINTNGTDSITGNQMNTALNGIIQFLGASGVTANTGTYSTSIPLTSGITEITIPLTYSPTFTIVQVNSFLIPAGNTIFVVNSVGITDGILVELISSITGTHTVSFSYYAI